MFALNALIIKQILSELTQKVKWELGVFSTTGFEQINQAVNEVWSGGVASNTAVMFFG